MPSPGSRSTFINYRLRHDSEDRRDGQQSHAVRTRTSRAADAERSYPKSSIKHRYPFFLYDALMVAMRHRYFLSQEAQLLWKL